MNKPFNPQTLNNIADCGERQSAAIDAFNNAMENQDYATAREICDIVIGSNDSNHDFGAGFQLHCLRWLTGHYHNRYVQSEDNSSEEESALEGLGHCLWVSKWVISRLPLDLNLSRQEIEEANEFMRGFYDDAGMSQAAVANCLMHQSIYMGDAQAAREHFQAWQSLEKDSGGDCEACEQNSLIEYHHFTGDYAQAVELAKPILSGSMTCGEIPHLTYALVIDSLIKLDRRQEASELLERAVEHIRSEGEAFYSLLAELAALHNKLGEKEAASDLLDEHSEDMVNVSQNNAMYYLEYLIAVASFNDEALTAARELAEKFDQRNGNSHYQSKLEFLFSTPVLH